MARFDLRLKPSVAKDLHSIPQEDVRRILARRIETLRENPRPPGSEKLSGQERYCVRHKATTASSTPSPMRKWWWRSSRSAHRREVYRDP